MELADRLKARKAQQTILRRAEDQGERDTETIPKLIQAALKDRYDVGWICFKPVGEEWEIEIRVRKHEQPKEAK